LEWNLEYGKFLGKYQQIYEKTGKMPSALAKRPEVLPHLLDYWNGFTSLDRSREWSMGGPFGIRYAEMIAFAAIHRFRDDDLADLAFYVGKLDNVYLKWYAEHGKT